MPRRTRVDAPGAVHHVVSRGIERGKLFRSRADYAGFVHRLGGILADTGGSALAWALMPNHIHLVLRTGRLPLSKVMHRLLLGYTAAQNSRLGRKGHLFEGRYKSILCEEDRYLRELVRYVHLNPVRAGICESLSGLERYPWSGHGFLMGRGRLEWQEVQTVLRSFGSTRTEARRKYVDFLSAGLKSESGLKGESLRRLVEGGWEVVKGVLGSEGSTPTESILGSEKFTRGVLAEVEEAERWKSEIRRKVTVAEVINRAAKEAGIPAGKVRGPSKIPACCRARSLACYWLVDVLGLREVEVARRLGITQCAVSINVPRGKTMAAEERLKLL